MKIIKGYHRNVFVFRRVVMKIIRIDFDEYFLANVRDFLLGLRKLDFIVMRYCLKEIIGDTGFLENIREFLCSLSVESDIIVPTYFSFFGIINLQKKQENLFGDDEDLLVKFLEIKRRLNYLTGDDSTGIHSFVPANFCVENNQVKILDYGEKGFRRLIQKHEKELKTALQKLIEK